MQPRPRRRNIERARIEPFGTPAAVWPDTGGSARVRARVGRALRTGIAGRPLSLVRVLVQRPRNDGLFEAAIAEPRAGPFGREVDQVLAPGVIVRRDVERT